MKRGITTLWTKVAAMTALATGPACSADPTDARGGAELDAEDEDAGERPASPSGGLTSFDRDAAVPGLVVDIALGGSTDEDVILDWLSSGWSGDVIVYRSADASELLELPLGGSLPPGVVSTSLTGVTSHTDVDAASQSIATPHYFYRVGLVDGTEQQLSTMVMKTTTATYAGYNTFGMCMLGGPGSASELEDRFGTSLVAAYAWDADTQSYVGWNPGGGTDFAIPYGSTVVVQLDGTTPAYRSLVGTVPTHETMAVTGRPGNNLTTIPVFFDGPTEASYWVDEVGFWGVGHWSNQTQSIAWYWGPGYADFDLEPCGAYEMNLPPSGCSSDADCSNGQRCYFDEGAVCGDVIAGLCLTPPTGDCDEPNEPSSVCGCDGNVYATACDAAVAGTSVRRSGSGGGGEVVFDFEGPVSPELESTGGWHRYDATPPSQQHAAVTFPSQVLGTDGNRLEPYPGSDNETSFATVGPITLGQTLTLQPWHVDEGGSSGYDRKRIYFEADTGEHWALVDCGEGINPQVFCASNNSSRPGNLWDEIVLDTAILAGQTGSLRFEYQTTDACCSFEQGWFVDDIATGECSAELTSGPPQPAAGPDECPPECLDMAMFQELVLDPGAGPIGSCYEFDYGFGAHSAQINGEGGFVLIYWDDLMGQCQSQAPGVGFELESVLGTQAAACGALVMAQIDALECN